MGAIKHLDIIPSIDPSLSSSDFVVEAGWGSPSSIIGVIRLAASKPLKEAKLILEFQGLSETFWVGSKVRRPGDPPGESFARRFQLVTTVVRDSKESLEPNEFGSVTLPFTIHLPPHGLPPSYSDGRGCIKYSLKSTLTWSETFQLLKPAHVANVPITIVMPRLHRLKLLRTPSTLEYDTPFDPDRCTCAIRLPTRVYIPGQQFTVQFAIPYIPQNRTISTVQTSIEASTTYRSITSDATKRNRNAVVWNPFLLALAREQPAPGELNSYDPSQSAVFSRTVHLVTDPKYHQPTLESSIISSRSIVKFQIFLDGDDEPHMAFETAIVVIPADTIKETAALRALEIARDQVRPSHEITLNTAIPILSHRSKGSSFSTTASIMTPLSSSTPNDDNSTMPPYSAGSVSPNPSNLHYIPSSNVRIPVNNNRSTTSSSNSGMHSVGSNDTSSVTFASGMLPPGYSTSLRSLDLPPPSSGNSNSGSGDLAPLTPISAATSIRTLSEHNRRPSLMRELSTLPEDDVALFEKKHTDLRHESDDDLGGLLTIDELADRLAAANLTRKEVGLMMVQSKSDLNRISNDSTGSGKSVVTGLIARLDSGHSWTTQDDGSQPRFSGIQSYKELPTVQNVSQLGKQLAESHINATTANTDITVDSATESNKLQDLLNSLNDTSGPHAVSSSYTVQHMDPYRAGENISRPGSAHQERSTQIQQIDDLLESLLAFEQDHQFNESDYESLLIAPVLSDAAGNDVTAPLHSSGNSATKLDSIITGNTPSGVSPQLPLTPPQEARKQPHITLLKGPRTSADLRLLHLSNEVVGAAVPTQHTQSSMAPLLTASLSDDADDASSKKQKAIARFSVLTQHTPHRPDELPLHVGDMVCIREIFRDGWCWGYNIESKSEGSFPMKKVQLYDSVIRV
ncbi:hypothetical protein BASA50_003443 [Batrachochytrium salamandrivorans]|uniref:SH3 domain-containing protein n=1 Tax=Batrachochytrium salamandrivorans TaxID=1357716 RepID=A0ABQ8FIQ4_9FUNG|nr:hypothetical protein BASA50_003443 [Batrachochytrium salamandrivorans]KAH9245667.1 hypothetical protein BASA81_016831 [Batrachochytrium salamandrivorans]KAH9273626.1 hypothetical protein BASA83_003957 [Batrachochytrium salamandrivorans]